MEPPIACKGVGGSFCVLEASRMYGDSSRPDLAKQQMDHAIAMQRADLALRAYHQPGSMTGHATITNEECRAVVLAALGLPAPDAKADAVETDEPSVAGRLTFLEFNGVRVELYRGAVCSVMGCTCQLNVSPAQGS